MMELKRIVSVMDDLEAGCCVATLEVEENGVLETVEYGVRPDDEFGMAPQVREAIEVWKQAGNVPEPFKEVELPPRKAGEFREFLGLFTPEEQLALKTAELSDAEIALWFEIARGGATVSLEHPHISDGLQKFVGAGLLAASRADEILAADFDKL